MMIRDDLTRRIMRLKEALKKRYGIDFMDFKVEVDLDPVLFGTQIKEGKDHPRLRLAWKPLKRVEILISERIPAASMPLVQTKEKRDLRLSKIPMEISFDWESLFIEEDFLVIELSYPHVADKEFLVISMKGNLFGILYSMFNQGTSFAWMILVCWTREPFPLEFLKMFASMI